MKKKIILSLFPALLAIALISAGCGNTVDREDPKAVVEEFGKLFYEGNYRKAYSYVSDEYFIKNNWDREAAIEEFIKNRKKNDAEIKDYKILDVVADKDLADITYGAIESDVRNGKFLQKNIAYLTLQKDKDGTYSIINIQDEVKNGN